MGRSAMFRSRHTARRGYADGNDSLTASIFLPKGICRRAAGISSPSGPTINNLALILVNNDTHSEGPKMRKLLVSLLITGSLCLTFTPRTAVAGSGEVAAGIVGGLAVGTLFGAAGGGGPRSHQQAAVQLGGRPVSVGPPPYLPPAAPLWGRGRGLCVGGRVPGWVLSAGARGGGAAAP